MCHPDNPDAPSNIEAAYETFLNAVELAKSHEKRTQTLCENRLTTAIVRDLCGEIAELLISELRSPGV